MKTKLMAILLTLTMAFIYVTPVSASLDDVTDDDVLTRAFFCAKLVEVFGLTANVSKNPYSDLDPSHKYYEEIMIVSNKGYLNGFADGTYRPEYPITRAEVAVVLSNVILGVDGAAKLPAIDDAWYSQYTNFVESNGIMTGIGIGDWTINAKVGDVTLFRTGNTAKKDDAVQDSTVTTEKQETSALPEISVEVNGQKVAFDSAPRMEQNRTLVPLRAIFEALNATVEWNGDTQTVTASRNDITISVKIGENKLTKNGEVVELEVPAQIFDSRTFVPVRAISESFNCNVDWNNDTRTVLINSAD